MKLAIVGALVVGIVIGIVLWLRRGHDDAPAAPEPAHAGSSSAPAPVGSAARVDAPQHVRKLAPADRKQLGEQISAARARARAAASAASSSGSGGPRPALDDTIPLEKIQSELMTALKEAIPILADCYSQAFGSDAGGRRAAMVRMSMTSDPDLGTVIDTADMTDDAGKQLDPKLDDCLRTTIESLALPPFEQGGKVNVQYSFKFD